MSRRGRSERSASKGGGGFHRVPKPFSLVVYDILTTGQRILHQVDDTYWHGEASSIGRRQIVSPILVGGVMDIDIDMDMDMLLRMSTSRNVL